MAEGGWDKRSTCVEDKNKEGKKKKKAKGEERNVYLDEKKKNKIMGKIK